MSERARDRSTNWGLDLTTGELLAAWREAERILRSTLPDTPEYQLALEVAMDARELYCERFDYISRAPQVARAEVSQAPPAGR